MVPRPGPRTQTPITPHLPLSLSPSLPLSLSPLSPSPPLPLSHSSQPSPQPRWPNPTLNRAPSTAHPRSHTTPNGCRRGCNDASIRTIPPPGWETIGEHRQRPAQVRNLTAKCYINAYTNYYVYIYILFDLLLLGPFDVSEGQRVRTCPPQQTQWEMHR
jgi:hypothetical protein